MEKEILVLKKRIKLFKKLIKREDVALERLKYKSRSIRLNNSHAPRKNWYVDRMQELQLVVSFLEGKTESKEFVHYQLDDGIGEICEVIGNASLVND